MACADVTSANIVGYNNIPLVQGSKLAGSIFKGISFEGMKLTQLVPTGYLSHPKWTKIEDGEGCKGYIKIEFLSPGGNVATDNDGNPMSFNWYHDYDSWDFFKWSDTKCWKRQLKGSTTWTEVTEANDVTINKGQAVWITVTQDYISGLSIQNNGEALLAADQVPLEQGATALVVPLSTDTTLTKLIPTGYLSHPKWTKIEDGEGCKGYIKIEFLSPGGNVATDNDGNPMSFNWYHDYDSWDFFKWSDTKCWKRQLKGSTTWTEVTEANDIEIKASDGLWVSVTQDWIPGLALSNEGVEIK